jgi:serine/threonine-protein kinase HipA
MSTLNVYFRDIPCARLTEEPGGALRLQYLESWIEEHGVPVCTRLPVTSDPFEHGQVAPFVASFLPEGKTLRNRLEKLLHVDADYDFGLLSAIGRESAGALSFWPEDEEPAAAPPRYLPLSEAEFDNWRAYSHQLPLQFPGRTIRLSLAGAQSKAALYFDAADDPYLPENGAPTTHILKPRIPGFRPNSVFLELITMRIARAVLGEERVPEADLWRNCYRVQRFDRPRTKSGVYRLHQEDFCLALGRMPNQKYESGSPKERLLAPCFDLIDDLGVRGMIRSPAVERLRLLDQVIVNVVLHNPDAHLKNYAFLYREDGALEIAPLYDCLCTYDLNFETNGALAWEQATGPAAHSKDLSLQIGNAERIDRVAIEDWESFAEECGFTQAFVRRRLRMLAESVREHLQPTVDAVLDAAIAADQAAADQAAIKIVEGVSRQIEAVHP